MHDKYFESKYKHFGFQGLEEESKNLFKSATDTVISLVKNVLSTSDDDGKEKENGQDNLQKVVDMKDIEAVNSSAQNTTVPPGGEEKEHSQPCLDTNK